MNGFWGLRSVPCRGCGQLLQYHASLLPRLRLGGHIFRFGLLIIAVWVTLKVLDVASARVLAITAWAGISVVLAGVLLTATRPSSIRLEVVSE